MSAAVAGLDAVLSRAGGQLTQMQECVRSMRRAEGLAASADGMVEVSVDAFGNPTAIRLAPGAAGLRPDELGRRIVETSHAAARELAAEHERILAVLSEETGLSAGAAPAGHPETGRGVNAYAAAPAGDLIVPRTR